MPAILPQFKSSNIHKSSPAIIQIYHVHAHLQISCRRHCSFFMSTSSTSQLVEPRTYHITFAGHQWDQLPDHIINAFSTYERLEMPYVARENIHVCRSTCCCFHTMSVTLSFATSFCEHHLQFHRALWHCHYGLIAEWRCSQATMGKAAKLLICWHDTAAPLVIPERQVILAQLLKYHY